MYFDVQTLARIVKTAHDPRHFSLRRAALWDTLVGVFSAVHVVNYLGERRDRAVHGDVSGVDVGAPIYIVAAPRSGTTFLHRLMALDPQFCTFPMYQSIFPTISARDVAESVTRRGGPLELAFKKVSSLIDKSFDGWDGMHKTGLGADEEDEAVWALSLATPAILILLPFPDAFRHLRFVDSLPEAHRDKLVRIYREVIQKRLYGEGGKTLLMKNVFLPGRFDIVTRAAPNARFVHIVRHPYEAIPSALSLFTLPWTVLAPEVYGPTETTRDFADLMIAYYRFFHDRALEAEARGDRRFVTLKYTDVVTDPVGSLQAVYDHFGLPLTDEVRATFERETAEQAEYRSSHAYSLEQFGIDEAYIASKLGDVMDHYGFVR